MSHDFFLTSVRMHFPRHIFQLEKFGHGISHSLLILSNSTLYT